jgi:hypothetical protein
MKDSSLRVKMVDDPEIQRLRKIQRELHEQMNECRSKIQDLDYRLGVVNRQIYERQQKYFGMR